MIAACVHCKVPSLDGLNVIKKSISSHSEPEVYRYDEYKDRAKWYLTNHISIDTLRLGQSREWINLDNLEDRHLVQLVPEDSNDEDMWPVYTVEDYDRLVEYVNYNDRCTEYGSCKLCGAVLMVDEEGFLTEAREEGDEDISFLSDDYQVF